jgi:hypothetical protein
VSSLSEFAGRVAEVNFFAIIVMMFFGLLFFVPLVLSRALHSAGAETATTDGQKTPAEKVEDKQADKREGEPTGNETDCFSGLTARDRTDILLSEWKVLVDMQMHFNDMILRMRTLAVSVVISVFGAAGFAIGQFSNRFVSLAGHHIHVASFVIAFGLILWIAVFLIDYGYYYRMLVGAVRRGWAIDDAFGGIDLITEPKIGLFGAARKISSEIGPRGASEVFVIGFYGIVYLAGWSYLLASLTLLNQP